LCTGLGVFPKPLLEALFSFLCFSFCTSTIWNFRCGFPFRSRPPPVTFFLSFPPLNDGCVPNFPALLVTGGHSITTPESFFFRSLFTLVLKSHRFLPPPSILLLFDPAWDFFFPDGFPCPSAQEPCRRPSFFGWHSLSLTQISTEDFTLSPPFPPIGLSTGGFFGCAGPLPVRFRRKRIFFFLPSTLPFDCLERAVPPLLFFLLR